MTSTSSAMFTYDRQRQKSNNAEDGFWDHPLLTTTRNSGRPASGSPKLSTSSRRTCLVCNDVSCLGQHKLTLHSAFSNGITKGTDSSMQKLLAECRHLRTSVLQSELARRRFPPEASLKRSLKVLRNLDQRVTVAKTLVCSPETESEIVLRPAASAIEQICADDAMDTSVSLDHLLRQLQIGLAKVETAVNDWR
mgnify:CR=1 FL=1